jgi:hypothetical protein
VVSHHPNFAKVELLSEIHGFRKLQNGKEGCSVSLRRNTGRCLAGSFMVVKCVDLLGEIVSWGGLAP